MELDRNSKCWEMTLNLGLIHLNAKIFIQIQNSIYFKLDFVAKLIFLTVSSL